MDKAEKHDEGKLRMDLIPPEAMEGLAEVLTIGARKYEERNWEQHGGLDPKRVVAALERHLLAVKKGEMVDPESGLSHLKHVLTNAAFLVTYEARGMLSGKVRIESIFVCTECGEEYKDKNRAEQCCTTMVCPVCQNTYEGPSAQTECGCECCPECVRVDYEGVVLCLPCMENLIAEVEAENKS